ncbi:hypothetical protein SAMN05216334_11131 [Nitrosomonas ureae]|uniref:Uncharacterized protein n=1 Tax=Nitrosomonas ureae TaxID=44577 RepID=A0A1H5V6C5_9PROT|nr:hypothetical protein SAMN05216334_11131 [Nitrosomonas ureae]
MRAGFLLWVELALQAEPLIAAKAKEQQIRKPGSDLANLPEQNPVNTRLATMPGVSAYRNFVHFDSAYSIE